MASASPCGFVYIGVTCILQMSIFIQATLKQGFIKRYCSSLVVIITQRHLEIKPDASEMEGVIFVSKLLIACLYIVYMLN